MARVQDSQLDVSGGMDSRVEPQRLGPSQYVDGLNIEIRDGYPSTKRGSFVVHEWQDSAELKAADWYNAPANDQRRDGIVEIRNTDVWLTFPPEYPIKMELPAGVTLSASGEYQFVQAFDYLYMLRGDNADVLRWNGFATSAWEVLPTATVGDQFPNSSRGEYAYNRLWVVEAADLLDASDLLSVRVSTLPNNSFAINDGEGGRIVKIERFVDGTLIVFKENSVHMLANANGDLSNLLRAFVDPDRGCVAGETVTMIGTDMWYLSRDGVRSIRLTSQNNVQMVDVPVSFPIPTLIDRINWLSVENAQGVVFDNYYLLAVPFDESQVNDTILVYDLLLKAWVGRWEGMACERLIVGRMGGREVLFGLNTDGDIVELLSGIYKENVPTETAYLDFSNGATDYVDADAVMTALDFSGFSTAQVSWSMILDQGVGTGTIFYTSTAAGDFLYAIMSAGLMTIKAETSAGAGWTMTYDMTTFLGAGWLNVAITHDGAEPTLWVNTGAVSAAFPVFTDKSIWFTSLAAANTLRIGAHSTTPAPLALPMGMRDFSIFKLDGSQNRTHHSMFPLGDGSGATTNEIQNNVDCAINDVSWIAFSAATDIATSWTSRMFTYDTAALQKVFTKLDITVDTRNPNYSVYVIKDRAFGETTLLDSQGYSSTEYDIHGKAAWTGTGVDFADPDRANYAPLTPVAGGIALETAAGVSYNVQPDREQRHTELIHMGQVADSCQFRVENTQGTLRLLMLAMVANAKRFGKRSEN